MTLPARYLILDVDDTLTTAGVLTEDVLAALRRADRAGIEVILNTGRSAGWGAALLQYLPAVSAAVVENGGAWFDARTPRVHTHEIPVAYAAGTPPDRAALLALRRSAAEELGWELLPTADDPFRLTDHTVVRTLPGGPQGAELLAELRRVIERLSGGAARILASSVHIHFYVDDPAQQRSKAAGVAGLLGARGIAADPWDELRRAGVAVGDSGNDSSLFQPGRFWLSAGVRNIERYLPELGECRPRHITRAAEGPGVVELIDDLLAGRLTG